MCIYPCTVPSLCSSILADPSLSSSFSCKNGICPISPTNHHSPMCPTHVAEIPLLLKTPTSQGVCPTHVPQDPSVPTPHHSWCASYPGVPQILTASPSFKVMSYLYTPRSLSSSILPCIHEACPPLYPRSLYSSVIRTIHDGSNLCSRRPSDLNTSFHS